MVWWQCRYGHEWKSIINSRNSGVGCPVCQKSKQTSFPEQVIYYYIKKAYPDALNGYRDIFPNTMELDIYIPKLKTGIEYDGLAWHSDTLSEKREFNKYNMVEVFSGT